MGGLQEITYAKHWGPGQAPRGAAWWRARPFSPPGRHSAPPSSGTAYQVQKWLLQLSFLKIHSLAAFVFSSKSSPKPQTFPNQGFKKTKSPSWPIHAARWQMSKGIWLCQSLSLTFSPPPPTPSHFHSHPTRSMGKTVRNDQTGRQSHLGELSQQDGSPHKSPCRGCSIDAPLTGSAHAQRHQKMVPMTTLLQMLNINVCVYTATQRCTEINSWHNFFSPCSKHKITCRIDCWKRGQRRFWTNMLPTDWLSVLDTCFDVSLFCFLYLQYSRYSINNCRLNE